MDKASHKANLWPALGYIKCKVKPVQNSKGSGTRRPAGHMPLYSKSKGGSASPKNWLETSQHSYTHNNLNHEYIGRGRC